MNISLEGKQQSEETRRASSYYRDKHDGDNYGEWTYVTILVEAMMDLHILLDQVSDF